MKDVQYPHQDALTLTARVCGFAVANVMVDTGSSADVLFGRAYDKMAPKLHAKLKSYDHELFGFNGQPVSVRGIITLPVELGDAKHTATHDLDFLVVDAPSPYTAILGRPTLSAFRMVVSQYHLAAKFPTPAGVGVCRTNQQESRSLYLKALKGGTVCAVETLGSDKHPGGPEPAEQTETILVGPRPEQTTKIGASLPPDLKDAITTFLRANRDVFAWTPEDMTGVPPEVITHQLRVNKTQRPVRQKRRHFANERMAAIEEEVQKLLHAGIVREEKYPTWLANVVMVKKPTGKWRMCVDYTDLNKACPKDCFPLPRIDQLVDSTAGHAMLSFMDAFSGYNQIHMDPKDQVHTSFVTHFGTYCYTMMPFGLKNAGATFQRLVTEVFKPQLGKNVESYVDDMIVKSRKSEDHLADLQETFDRLRRYNLKLNPMKCVFAVGGGKFLGYLVNERGIEANPEKIQAILDMNPPRKIKEVQQLAGRVAALNRFLSRSAERCFEFFRILKNPSSFQWTAACQSAFDELKTCLSTPPILSAPVPQEELYLYLAVSDKALSAVLVRNDHGHHKPVYYVSHALQGAETRYTKLEKFALAVIISARRLRPYFQAHPVTVLTDMPLRSVLSKPDLSGRMMKYAIELSAYGVRFQPREAKKAQVLADFVAEYTGTAPQGEHGDLPEWTLQVDGSSTRSGSGAGLVLTGPHGAKVLYALKFGFKASNNEAEYEALIAGLKIAKDIGARRVRALSDSMLVVQQVRGDFEAKGDVMIKYLRVVRNLLLEFTSWRIDKIPREENVEADRLSKFASITMPELDREDLSKQVFVEYLPRPSTDVPPEVLEIHNATSGPCWMDPIVAYLRDGVLPTSRKEAKRVLYQATQYTLVDNTLYKRGLSSPLLRCLHPDEGKKVLEELHAGVCSNHVKSQALYVRALRLGYYWPTLKADAKDMVQHCHLCQKHANIPRAPATDLQPLTSPWPFAQWGLDLLGPFSPPAQGQRRFIIVAVDYFTKWAEAEALSTITERNIQAFVHKNITTRFGVPHSIIMDNGRQFDCDRFREYCAKYHIQPHYTSVAHPQSNGQVEAINKTIVASLRKKVARAPGKWAEEVPNVLWGYRTTHRTSTGETPYRLAFGSEAVLPIELELPTIRTQELNLLQNQIGLCANLDTMEENFDLARRRVAAYQLRAARYYNKQVRHKVFHIGDLVCRKLQAVQSKEGQGKLAPNWEDPVRVKEDLGNGAYRLETIEGLPIARTWNARDLQKYFN